MSIIICAVAAIGILITSASVTLAETRPAAPFTVQVNVIPRAAQLQSHKYRAVRRASIVRSQQHQRHAASLQTTVSIGYE